MPWTFQSKQFIKAIVRLFHIISVEFHYNGKQSPLTKFEFPKLYVECTCRCQVVWVFYVNSGHWNTFFILSMEKCKLLQKTVGFSQYVNIIKSLALISTRFTKKIKVTKCVFSYLIVNTQVESVSCNLLWINTLILR